MGINIITEQPGWMIVFCLLAGSAAAGFLYYKNKSLIELSRSLLILLATLRFLSVSLIAFLLLGPLIKTIFHETEQPLIVLIQDGSVSVMAGQDSTSFDASFITPFKGLSRELSDKFEVKTFTIGDHNREGIGAIPSDKSTDLSSVVDIIRSRFSGRNLGAVVLASDGLFNTGSNPLYAYEKLNTPVYTIGLGDTVVHRDLLISGLRYNKTTFKGNSFPVEINIDAKELLGEKARLTISKEANTVYEQQINITSNRFNILVPVFLEAKEAGVNKYSVKLDPLPGEHNLKNNQSVFYIELIEEKIKVLIVNNAPHPDITLLKEILNSSDKYDVSVQPVADLSSIPGNTSLVILHQVPASHSATALAELCRKTGIPVWYILGAQTAQRNFNELQTGLLINDIQKNTNDVLAVVNNDFTGFTINDELFNQINRMPPLTVPFGTYQLQKEGHILLKQRIGNVVTAMPLLCFFNDEKGRIAVLCGEGLWKWGLSEFNETGNKAATSALITKTIQYLTSQGKKTPFRVYLKSSYSEADQITGEAELYNSSGELTNQPEAAIVMEHEDGRKFNFNFSRTENGYYLNAGYLPSGTYRYSASVTLGSENYRETGLFSVSEVLAEQSETTANHGLLRAISAATGGAFLSAAQMVQLRDSMANKADIVPVTYERKKLDDFVNLKWFFFLLIALLSVEWMLRKRSGIY